MKRVVKNGRAFYVSGPDAPNIKGFWDLVEAGDWENDTFSIFDAFLDKKHSYIDIGAWIGPTVLYACQLVKHCYAVEPDPVALGVLKENLRLNPDLKGRITLSECCIGESSGEAKLGTATSFGDSMSSLQLDGPGAVTVKSVTFEDLVRKNDIGDCNFIKMDIEGGEAVVLPLMGGYLKRDKPTLFLSLHPFLFKDKEGDSKAIIGILKIYPHLYGVDGMAMSPDKLLRNMLSIGKENFSVIATVKWDPLNRLSRILDSRFYKIAHKFRKKYRKLFR